MVAGEIENSIYQAPMAIYQPQMGQKLKKPKKYCGKLNSWYLDWNSGGLGVSGRSARTIRNFSFELSPDLVLLDIRKSTFQHLTVNTSSQNGLKTFLMDPVLENKSFYFRYLHIPLSISKTEK